MTRYELPSHFDESNSISFTERSTRYHQAIKDTLSDDSAIREQGEKDLSKYGPNFSVFLPSVIQKVVDFLHLTKPVDKFLNGENPEIKRQQLRK